MPANPFLDPAFQIRWSQLDPAAIAPAIEEALERADAVINAIARQPLDSLTYENSFLALERATEELNVAWGKVTHLQSVADSPALREAHNAMLPKVTAFLTGIPLNAVLWARLKAFADSPVARALTGIRRRHLTETVSEFVQAGADLPAGSRARLEALQSELAEVAQKFASTLSKFSEMDSELIKSKEAKQVALASVADLQSKYEALLSKVSGIQSEAKTVEEKVAKTVASLGVEPVTNSPSELSVESTEKSAEEILKEWSAMTDAKAKRAFYLKNQSRLIEATFPSKKK